MATDSRSTYTHELSRAVEQAIARFEAALRLGERPTLEEYLPVEPSTRPVVLKELVHTELEYRLKAGERRLAEEYFQRFPELASDRREAVALIAAEYRLAHRLDDNVTPASFLDRFPELSDDLAPSLTRSDSLPVLPGYEVLDVLGRGGMGIVYRARQPQLGRVVALKVILAGAHASEEEQERFRTEARTVASLQHPNIVQIYEVGSHQSQVWLTLEYCAGGTLADRLRESPLPAREAAELVRTLAHAMHTAHQHQIIHRDLKPANVLLAVLEQPSDNDKPSSSSSVLAGLVPKISDFGLAKKLDASQITQSGAVLGTPSYMAPEQAQGQSESLGPPTDVYALGAILYECLTGRPPFKAATALDTMMQVIADEPVPPARLQPQVSRDLDTITLKCLQKDPRKRYATARELADDLGRLLEGRAIAARPVGRLERAGRWCRRNPVVASLSAVLLLVLLGGLVSLYGLWRRAEGHRQNAEETAAAMKKLLGEFVTTTTKTLAEIGSEQRGPMNRQLDAAHEAAARFGQLPGAQPQDERFLTLVHLLQGDLKERTDPLGALASYEQARANAQRLSQVKPENPQLRKDLVFALDRIARIHLKQTRQLDRSTAALEEALALARQTADQTPDDEEAQRQVIICLNDRGDVHFERGELPQAEAAFEEGRQRTERLFKRFPERIPLQHDLSVSHERVANVQRARGNGPAALASMQRVVELREKVVAAEPTHRLWKDDLCVAYRKLGQILQQLGDPKQAVAVFNKGYALSEAMVQIESASANELNELAIWHLSLGTLYLRENDIAAARTSFEAFIALLQQAIARDVSQSSMYQRNLTVGYNYLGRVFQTIQDYPNAREQYLKSLPIAEDLARRYPNDLEYHRDLGLLRLLLGTNALTLNDYETSQKDLLAALDSFDRLAKRQPDVLERQSDLAEVCEKLFQIALVREPEQAGSWAERGLKALEPFAQIGRLKDLPVVREQYERLQGMRQQAGKLREVLASLDNTLQQPAEEVPGLLTTRALTLARRGEWIDATLTADALADWKPTTAESVYDAACVHALAVAPSAARPLAVRERHAARALELLRRAVELGYRNLTHLQRDPDLAALRTRPEYQAIEHELVEKLDKSKN